MNQINIIGNVTKDVELRETSTGRKVCTFNVAVNGRKNDEPQFFRCTAWEKLAESCAQYLTKGKKVAVSGSIFLSEFTAKSGEKHATLEVNARDVEFLSQKQEQKAEEPGYEEVGGEDLPF